MQSGRSRIGNSGIAGLGSKSSFEGIEQMTNAEIFESRLKAIFTPCDTRSVWEWAQDNITIGERQSQVPGPYSTLLTPYVREPLECYQDRDVQDLVLCWGSQTAKTSTIMIGAVWRIVHSPSPIVWVMPNSDLAQSFSENRWIPMVEDSPPLSSLKPKDKNLFKKLEQQFQRCTLTFVGSNSPANLASRPAGLLIMDEIDKFARANERESSALMLAENRTKSFTSPLRVKTSTPTTERGDIWQEFIKGDQRYYHVPCPHCGSEIRLVFSQVKWDKEAKDENGRWNHERVSSSAYYECQKCQGKISDANKTSMLRKGRWIPTNENAERGRRSYHLCSIYAPWRSCNFGRLAVQFLQAKETINGLQDFVNSALAEPWNEDASFERKEDSIDTYEVTEPWNEERIRFMTVDVQEDHFWHVIRAWSSEGKSRLLSEGKLTTFEEIKEKGAEFNVSGRRIALDFGFTRRSEVPQQALKNGWFGLRGDNKKSYTWTTRKGIKVHRLFSSLQAKDAFTGTAQGRRFYAPYCFWGNSPIKDLLDKLRKSNSPGWYIYGNVSDDYKWQIDAEVRKLHRNPRSGVEEFEWYQVRRDNHLFDCECMQVVLALMAGVIRATKEDSTPEDSSNSFLTE